jgi:hypothetical protein
MVFASRVRRMAVPGVGRPIGRKLLDLVVTENAASLEESNDSDLFYCVVI